jgi:hypothetical protein
LVKCLFSLKNDKKAKKRHGTYSKNYFIRLDQNPKIENFEKKFEKSITRKMDLIRNLKKWSKISSKHFLSQNCQFTPKLVIFDHQVLTKSRIFGKNDQFFWKLTAQRPRKGLMDYFYDMNLVRNVQKCSKMRSLKLKRKRGDWKSLKKVRKKSFVWRGIFFDLLDSVFWLLIGWKFFSSSRDLRHLRHRRQSPPSGNTNRVANRL